MEAGAAAAEGRLLPTELIHELLTLGVQRAAFPCEAGGLGLGQSGYLAALEELGRAEGSLGAVLMATGSALTAVHQFGTPDQRRRWMLPVLGTEGLGAIALSEARTGSDPRRTRTVAELDGEGAWRLWGEKSFITNAGHPDLALVVTLARAPDGELSSFLVDPRTPAAIASPCRPLTGWRAAGVAHLVFRGCRAALLGVPGRGLAQMLSVLTLGRIAMAALGVGLCTAAMDQALSRAMERDADGIRIWDHSAIRLQLVEMGVRRDIARALVVAAALAVDRGEDIRRAAATAKLVASRYAVNNARSAVQVFGAEGLLQNGPTGRMWGDAKVLEIVEGTSEIQQLVLGQAMERAGGGLE